MFDFLLKFPAWIQGTIFIGTWVVLGVLFLKLISKFTRVEHIKNSKESINSLMQILAILFAVLLAFLVVVVWEKYDKNSDNVESEVNCLMNINRDSKWLNDTSYAKLKPFLVDYAYSTVMKDWKSMDINSKSDPSAGGYIRDFADTLNSITLYNPKETLLYQNIIREYNHLLECRVSRISAAGSELPIVLWFTIISGCLVTLFFSYFFYFEKPGLHYLLTALISFMMGVTLFLIFVLDHPFKGNNKIQPDTFAKFYNGISRKKPVHFSKSNDIEIDSIVWKNGKFVEILRKK
jgi:hypothetical protein